MPPSLDVRQLLWRRIDLPGHELAQLAPRADGMLQLDGTAIFSHHGEPTLMTYDIVCDPDWHTRRARVQGRRGRDPIELVVTVDSSGRWWRNAEALPSLDGCIDVDLGFSPSTNLLPIRRLALPIGGSAAVRAAWVRFPELSVEVLEQVYHRTAERRYTYESNGGAFRAELTVDDAGFVIEYPNLWTAERVRRSRAAP